MAHIPAPGEVFYGEDGTTSVVLADNYNPEYEPSSEELHEYAEYIGIDWRKEPELLHLAKEGLQAPLPHAWRACQTSDDEVYYFNFETGESLWDHPLDAQFKKRVTEERNKIKNVTTHNAKSQDNNTNTNKNKNKNKKIQNTSGSIAKKKEEEEIKQTSLLSGNKLNKLHAITPLSQVISNSNNHNNSIAPPSLFTATNASSSSTSLTPLPMPFALSPPLSLPSHHLIHSHMTQHAPLGVKDIETQIRKRVDDEYAVLKKKLNLELEEEIDARRSEMQHRLVQTKAEYEKEWNMKSRELYLAAEKQKVQCRSEVEEKYKTQIKEMENEIFSLAREIRNECSRSYQEKQQQQQEEENEKAQQHQLSTNAEKGKSSSNNNNVQNDEYSRELTLYEEKLQSELQSKVEEAKLDFAQKIDGINKENEIALRQLRSKLSKESEEKLNYVKRQSQIMIAQLESKLRQKKEELEASQQKQANNNKEAKLTKETATPVIDEKEKDLKEKQNKEVEHVKQECERELQQVKDEYERKMTSIQNDIRCIEARLVNINLHKNHEKSETKESKEPITTTTEITTKVIQSLYTSNLNNSQMKEVQRSMEIENNKYITSLKALESRHERLIREIRQVHERALHDIHHNNNSGKSVFDPRKAPPYNTTLTQRKRAWLQAHPAPKYTLPTFTSSSIAARGNTASNNKNVSVSTPRMLEEEPEIEVDEEEVEEAVHKQICEAKQKWTKEYEVALNTEREREMSKLDEFKRQYRAEKLKEITEQLTKEEEHEEPESQKELQQHELEEALKNAQVEKNKLQLHEELEKLQKEAEMDDAQCKAEKEQLQLQITQAEHEMENLQRELELVQKENNAKEYTEEKNVQQESTPLHLFQQEKEKCLKGNAQMKMIRLEWEAVLTALHTAIRAEEQHYHLLQSKRDTNHLQDNFHCSIINNNNKMNDSAREIDAEVSIAARTPNVNTPLTHNKQYTHIPLHTNTGLINSSRKRVCSASMLHSLNNSRCSTNSNIFNISNSNNSTPYEAISSSHARLSAILKQNNTDPRKMTTNTINSQKEPLQRNNKDNNNNSEYVYNDDSDVRGANSTKNVSAIHKGSEGQESWMSLQERLHALHQTLRERRSAILGEQATLKNLRAEWTSDLQRCKVNKDKHQAHYLQAVKIKLEEYAHKLNEKVLALKEAQSLLRLEKKRCASSSINNNISQPRRMSHQLVSIANNYPTEEDRG